MMTYSLIGFALISGAIVYYLIDALANGRRRAAAAIAGTSEEKLRQCRLLACGGPESCEIVRDDPLVSGKDVFLPPECPFAEPDDDKFALLTPEPVDLLTPGDEAAKPDEDEQVHSVWRAVAYWALWAAFSQFLRGLGFRWAMTLAVLPAGMLYFAIECWANAAEAKADFRRYCELIKAWWRG